MLSKEELINFIKGQNYDAVLCLLTDKIDADVLEASRPTVKILPIMRLVLITLTEKQLNGWEL